MKKNILSSIKILVLGLFLAFVFSSVVNVWAARPTSPAPAGNTATPINESASVQTKSGGSIVLGSATASARGGLALDVLGSLFTDGYVSEGGTNIFGNLDVANLAIAGITSNATPKNLCLNTEGAIITCSGGAPSGTHGVHFKVDNITNYTWNIPVGVSQLTVELWGAGGAGAGTGPNSATSSNTNGNPSTFSCNGAFLTANGGTKGYVTGGITNVNNTGLYGYGTGGSWSTNGNANIISTAGSTNGGSGGFTAGLDSSVSTAVSSPSYFGGYARFALGGIGGDSIGGSSGPTPQTISKGGKSMTYANVAGGGGSTGYPFNYPSIPNLGNTPGGGGTAPGGPSGQSIEDFRAELGTGTDCSYSPYPCKGKTGIPGGGGGGYIKAVINIGSSSSCSYTIGSGGVAENNSSGWFGVAGGQNGGNGGIKITY